MTHYYCNPELLFIVSIYCTSVLVLAFVVPVCVFCVFFLFILDINCLTINVLVQSSFRPYFYFFVYRDDVLCWLLSCPFASVYFSCLSPNV